MKRETAVGAVLVVAVLSIILPDLCTAQAPPCFNQLQVLGSHNSFHQVPPKPIIDLLNSDVAKAAIPASAFLPQSWEYSHASLTDQLNAGVRAFELDVHPDPAGGLFSAPAMLKFAGVDPNLPEPALKQPGFKVLHVPDIDFGTSCFTFVSCLTAIKTWSNAHPDHAPINIIIEPNFGETDLVRLLQPAGVELVNSQLAASPLDGPDSLTTQPPVSTELLTALESEITSVFPLPSIITPDSVRSSLGLDPGANLTARLLQNPSISTCPWPSLDTLRGKVIFQIILNDQNSLNLYKSMHPNQQGALAWLVWDAFPVPDAVFYSAGNLDISERGGVIPPTIPKNATAIVDALVKDIKAKSDAGYIVRGRTDANTVEARAGYAGRYTGVLNSQANIVATDFPMLQTVLRGINYMVQLPGGVAARCINGAAGGYSMGEVTCGGGKGPVPDLLFSGEDPLKDTKNISTSSNGGAGTGAGNGEGVPRTATTMPPLNFTTAPSSVPSEVGNDVSGNEVLSSPLPAVPRPASSSAGTALWKKIPLLGLVFLVLL